MRIFLAVPVPSAVAGELLEEQERLRGILPGARWTDINAFHLTLKFLGEVSPGRIDAVEAVSRQAVEKQRPFRVELKGIGAFPSSRAPKTLWAGVSDGKEELTRLAESLDMGFLPLGFAREERRYRPHVTLGRLNASLFRREMIEVPASFGGFEAKELNIMQSELRPRGPKYTILRRCPFKENECLRA